MTVRDAVRRRMRWLRRAVGRGRERGSLSLFFAVAGLGVLLAIGLVADGGAALNAPARADDVAQEAARAGAQQIDPGKAIPGQAVEVDPAAAARAARTYLAREDTTGTVAVSGATITVRVHASSPTAFGSLLGYTRITVTGEGTARLIHQGG